MDRRGNAPRWDCLQGIPAPLCAARGAQSWLRSNLSAVSARRCHQISCLSSRWRCYARLRTKRTSLRMRTANAIHELERTAGIKPASERWRRPALSLSYVRMVGSGRNRTSCPAGTAFTAQRLHQHVLIGTSRNCSWSLKWRKAEVLIPTPCGATPLRTGAGRPSG